MPLTQITTLVSKSGVFASVTIILTVVLASPYLCVCAQAQPVIAFKSNDAFAIPDLKGVVRFSTNGTYEHASLENGSWRFVNLSLNNSFGLQRLNLTVSAENSDVTILSYRTFNISLNGVSLRYNVSGQGKQAFNFGEIPKVGEWSVAFNGVFMGLNDGWTVSSDQTITVMAKTVNVSIAYYTLPDVFGDAADSNTPLYQRHSVAIGTAVAVAFTAAFAVAIWRINRIRKKESTEPK